MNMSPFDNRGMQLDQILSKLTEQDKQTLKERVGIELETRRLNPELLAQYERFRRQVEEVEAKAPSASGSRHGVRCSFCQRYVTEVAHMMKLSESHVMCDLCIGLLVELVRERA